MLSSLSIKLKSTREKQTSWRSFPDLADHTILMLITSSSQLSRTTRTHPLTRRHSPYSITFAPWASILASSSSRSRVTGEILITLASIAYVSMEWTRINFLPYKPHRHLLLLLPTFLHFLENLFHKFTETLCVLVYL